MFLFRALAFYIASDWLVGPRIIKPVMAWVGSYTGLVNDHQTHLLSSGRAIIFDTVVLSTVLLTVALLICTERSPLQNFSLSLLLRRNGLAGGDGYWKRLFGFGALLGGGLATTILVGLGLAGMMRMQSNHQNLATSFRHQLLLAFASLAAGLTEEVSYRGYAQYALERGLSFWPAATLTSIWFGWSHYGEGDPLFGALSVAVWGVVSCLALRVTGNLAMSIGFHAMWNYVENGIFGVSDSSFIFGGAWMRTVPHGPAVLTGASVGPEGSIIFFLANALMIAGLLFWHSHSMASQRRLDSREVK